MQPDLERLRYLAAEGDTQAATELARQEQRLGLAVPALLDLLRAEVTAARIYTRRLLDGITEGEGAATRRDLARMLAALYCGCDYSITPPRDT